MIICDEIRCELGLPRDCGLFDPIRNIWYISDIELKEYQPDVYRRLYGDNE